MFQTPSSLTDVMDHKMISYPHCLSVAGSPLPSDGGSVPLSPRATCLKPRRIPRRWGVKHYHQAGGSYLNRIFMPCCHGQSLVVCNRCKTVVSHFFVVTPAPGGSQVSVTLFSAV